MQQTVAQNQESLCDTSRIQNHLELQVIVSSGVSASDQGYYSFHITQLPIGLI